jgi:hypothetical protein
VSRIDPRRWLRTFDGREALQFAAQAVVLWFFSSWPS